MKMLEHQKCVIKKVSSNDELFKKELYKSLAWLEIEDLTKLVEWLKNNYWRTNRREIKTVFKIYMTRDGDTFYYKKLEQ